MQHLHDALVNAPERTRLLVQNSGHVLTRDAARAQVFDAVTQFILRLESRA
jgi:esterase/lipase